MRRKQNETTGFTTVSTKNQNKIMIQEGLEKENP